ncbi:glycine cleavage T-protein [Teladorsagia circumcincta]|uniref:Glycine cleavage T-protein n=1 Tax=Teladorsagia circumcincta TaxID=45464 RepID=A0A2G9V2G7_TELCI|nr:glycine cleavage T-protein [Teladorsagia circumcincta]
MGKIPETSHFSYERPLWYDKTPKSDRNALYWGQDSLVGKPIWFDEVAAEYEACRERVGLIDMSSFAKFDITEISIGMATGIRAISVTHCGELGWVIYIPNEVAQNVYERIVEAGREYSLVHSGYYALRQLRIEKFYVYWGQDINATVTPVECGRSFRVDFKKDFIGKQALEKQLERGVSKRFVQLLVDNHDKELDPWPQGGEVVFRDGKPVGMTTSAAYGFTLGCQVR